ncbi:MAG: SagB/ThcOx family dehydrogenase [Micropruina sp.]|nr:SagB/ThcOx family dehydrogenase [Micropruina sp.]
MDEFTFADAVPLAWTFHRGTARWLFNASAGGESPPVVPGRENGALPWTPLPTAELPAVTLSDAVQARVSCRRFLADPLTPAEVAVLLRAAYGIGTRSGPAMQDRPPPSGGGLYPLELTLLVRAVENLEPGVYHYVPAANGLERVQSIELPAAFLTYLFMGQPWVAEAAVITVLSFAGGRSLTKYGDRGYRYALLEAGHTMQNLNLAVAALGLGCVNLGGFYDDELAVLAGIDVESELPLYCCAIGRPDAAPDDRMRMRALERAEGD